MNIEDVLDLRRVNGTEFIRRYNAASSAVGATRLNGGANRWPVAAEQVCRFLTFTIEEEPLWSGLHQAVDGLESESNVLSDIVRDSLDDFVIVEFELLVRRGLSELEAARITDALRIGLLSFEHPTHEEVEELHASFRDLQGRLCTGVEWRSFGKPEDQARRKVNLIAALTGGGGLVSTVVNAATIPAPPLFLLSIAGGIVSTVGSLLGWRWRR